MTGPEFNRIELSASPELKTPSNYTHYLWEGPKVCYFLDNYNGDRMHSIF